MRFILAAFSLILSCTAFADMHEFLARGQALDAGSEGSPMKARLYALRLDSYQNIVILNPGGLIPALAMSGLAEALAQKGSLVFVLENPNDLPIQAITLATDVATAIRTRRDQIQGLPRELQTPAFDTLPLKAFGHSLGGAVLGAALGDPSSRFQEIILMGVSRLVTTPTQAAMKVTMLLGEKDGLASRSSVDELAQTLGTRTQVVPGVNHFCIISDPGVGAPDKKAQDLQTDLTPAQCVGRVVEVLQKSWALTEQPPHAGSASRGK